MRSGAILLHDIHDTPLDAAKQASVVGSRWADWVIKRLQGSSVDADGWGSLVEFAHTWGDRLKPILCFKQEMSYVAAIDNRSFCCDRVIKVLTLPSGIPVRLAISDWVQSRK